MTIGTRKLLSFVTTLKKNYSQRPKTIFGDTKLKGSKIVQGRSIGIERNVETKTIIKKRKLFF